MKPPIRVLAIWALVSALLFGLAGFGNPLDDIARALRDRIREHPASGQVVIVGIDFPSVQKVGNWPWDDEHFAAMVDNLSAAGARRIVFDFSSGTTTDNQHRALVEAIENSTARVYLTANFAEEPTTGIMSNHLPSADLRKVAGLVNSNFWVTGFNTVKTVPYGVVVGDLLIPSISAELGGVDAQAGKDFQIDYSIAFDSIPYLSAVDVLSDPASLAAVNGKDVIIGANATGLGNRYSIVGHGPVASVFISALGVETLQKGRPIQISWILPWLTLLPITVAIFFGTLRRHRFALFALGSAILAGVPFALENMMIFANYMPAIVLFIGASGHSAWMRQRNSYQERGLVNQISGLPNLNALRQKGHETANGLVAARIQNYAEVATALAAALEKDLVDQIAMRFALGNGGRPIFQGDEGIFMWLIPPENIPTVGDQLVALQAIFRSPATVAGRNIDLSVSFGIDADPGRSIQNRMSSALLAAQEAMESGENWKVYDPSRLEATEWKVSLLGELDAAIDSGQVWVAFQPKLDLKTNKICGAEALVRWSHPEKGSINPEEFILAAEKHNRIGKLTEHVLNRAVEAAAQINLRSAPFDISVNLSPRLLGGDGLNAMVMAALDRNHLQPERLILEITETAAMSSATKAIEDLNALRAMGLQLSIDDYGTGFSTLDYLKRCPATELKIDRSFIRMLNSSRSDRIMVNSTIELAHSLGEQVVAEGVEDSDTLQMLRQMGCDMAQGFLIARPMPYDALCDYLDQHEKSRAA